MAACDKKSQDLDAKIDGILTELEKVSGMSVKEAHDEIMARVESKMSGEIAAYIKNQEDEARDTAENKARDIGSWLAISTLKKSRPNAPSPSFRFLQR
jgi:ribonuclease Y